MTLLPSLSFLTASSCLVVLQNIYFTGCYTGLYSHKDLPLQIVSPSRVKSSLTSSINSFYFLFNVVVYSCIVMCVLHIPPSYKVETFPSYYFFFKEIHQHTFIYSVLYC